MREYASRVEQCNQPFLSHNYLLVDELEIYWSTRGSSSLFITNDNVGSTKLLFNIIIYYKLKSLILHTVHGSR
jgi:hypothetical protein